MKQILFLAAAMAIAACSNRGTQDDAGPAPQASMDTAMSEIMDSARADSAAADSAVSDTAVADTALAE